MTFTHREYFQGSQDKFQIKVIRGAIIKPFNHHLMDFANVSQKCY